MFFSDDDIHRFHHAGTWRLACAGHDMSDYFFLMIFFDDFYFFDSSLFLGRLPLLLWHGCIHGACNYSSYVQLRADSNDDHGEMCFDILRLRYTNPTHPIKQPQKQRRETRRRTQNSCAIRASTELNSHGTPTFCNQ